MKHKKRDKIFEIFFSSICRQVYKGDGEMKAGVYVSETKAVMQQKAKPVIKKGEALVKVSHAGICGTDMMIYFGKHPRAQAPLTMGHEFSGVIEEIRGETEFSLGDRVAVEPTA